MSTTTDHRTRPLTPLMWACLRELVYRPMEFPRPKEGLTGGQPTFTLVRGLTAYEIAERIDFPDGPLRFPTTRPGPALAALEERGLVTSEPYTEDHPGSGRFERDGRLVRDNGYRCFWTATEAGMEEVLTVDGPDVWDEALRLKAAAKAEEERRSDDRRRMTVARDFARALNAFLAEFG